MFGDSVATRGDAIHGARVHPADDLVSDDDESKFEGVLVWIRQWGIGSETSERVGMNIVESMRLAKGEARSVNETPAHLFDEHELVEAHALLLQPLFFEWDAFVVPSSGKYFAMADHDSVLRIVTQHQVHPSRSHA